MPKGNLRVVRTVRDTDKDYFDQLNKLLDQIYQVATNEQHWTWHRLSIESGISPETVNRLGERTTKYPHLRTVLRLAEAVGLNVKLIPVLSKAKHSHSQKKGGQKRKVG